MYIYTHTHSHTGKYIYIYIYIHIYIQYLSPFFLLSYRACPRHLRYLPTSTLADEHTVYIYIYIYIYIYTHTHTNTHTHTRTHAHTHTRTHTPVIAKRTPRGVFIPHVQLIHNHSKQNVGNRNNCWRK